MLPEAPAIPIIFSSIASTASYKDFLRQSPKTKRAYRRLCMLEINLPRTQWNNSESKQRDA